MFLRTDRTNRADLVTITPHQKEGGRVFCRHLPFGLENFINTTQIQDIIISAHKAQNVFSKNRDFLSKMEEASVDLLWENHQNTDPNTLFMLLLNTVSTQKLEKAFCGDDNTKLSELTNMVASDFDSINLPFKNRGGPRHNKSLLSPIPSHVASHGHKRI